MDNVRIPAGETLEMPSPVNVAHLAPEGAVQLSPGDCAPMSLVEQVTLLPLVFSLTLSVT
jgi:hypothetical protein